MKGLKCVIVSVISAGVLLVGCGAEDPTKLTACDGGQFLVDGECTALTGTWNRIETGGETICSRGEPYSFFFHPGTNNKVLIYYAFGGFCYNATTCRDGAPNYVTHVDVDENILLATGGIMDLNNDENPFKDWNIVYVPDCTADFSTGNKVTEHPASGGNPAITINHMGFVNASTVHEWMYSNFLRPESMVVSGSSGGGDAAIMHYPYIREHYKAAPVKNWVMLLDSSFGIVPEEFHTTFSATWGMYDNRPMFIPEIASATPAEMTQDYCEIVGDKFYPDGITAELGSSDDVLQGFTLSIMGGDRWSWPEQLQNHLDNVSANTERFRHFVVPGTHHIIINQNSFYEHELNGRRMRDWVADLADGKDVESARCTENCSVNTVELVEAPGQEVGILCTTDVHCPQDEVCCGNLATQTAECHSSCEAGQTQLCREALECTTGSRCQEFDVMSVNLGICL